MKLRLEIVACLLFVQMGLIPAVAQDGRATGRALLISDIHLDPLSDPAIVRRLIAAPLSRWRPILQSAHERSLSTYGADTNYPLFASTLAEIAAQKRFDYVVFTGDALRHNFSQAFVTAGGTSDQFPAFAAKTEAFVIEELQDKLKAPVLAALGNNDSPCNDYQIPPNSPFLAALADHLRVLAASPEAKSTFRMGGFFSIAHPTVPNQDVIVLNTIFWSTSYKSCAPDSGDPGDAEMEWLGWKLYNAAQLHHGVTLVMHIPPGMDAYDSSHGQCQSPVSFWQDKYQARFSALMNAYSNVVQLAFAGHIHMDDFQVTDGDPSFLPLRITPSVSPIFGNNPAFSVMTYDRTKASVSDIKTYFLPLSSQTPLWAKEYEFSSAYNVGSFSAANLSTIAGAIRSGGAAQATFEKNYAVSAPSPIHSSNLSFYSCAQTDFTARSYSDCVCGAAAPVSQHPAACNMVKGRF